MPSAGAALVVLGREHRRVGVRDEHYTIFSDALIAALHRHTDDVWVPELEAAWRRVFAFVAATMQSGARGAAGREPARWSAEVLAHERRTDDIAVLGLRTDRPEQLEGLRRLGCDRAHGQAAGGRAEVPAPALLRCAACSKAWPAGTPLAA